jgi:hypothetical protein
VRELHVIGFTSDHGGLLLSAKPGAKTGSYVLTLDGAVFEQIEKARLARSGIDASEPPRPRLQIESALSPREIQARIRSGRTVSQVASEAGVSVEWIDRFAAPVLAEQIAAAQRAGRAYLTTTRRGTSDRPLAAAVARNLAIRGVRMDEHELNDAWTAHHLADSEWLVSLRFRSRGRSVVAQWIYNAANNTLVSKNRLGADLGYAERPKGVADPNAVAALPTPGATPLSHTRPARPRPLRKAASSNGRAVAGRAAAGRAAAAKVSVITSAASPAERPSTPRSATKSAAASRRTAKSAAKRPAKPSAKRPAKPPAKRPAKPSAKRPAKPSAKRPAKPPAKGAAKPASKRATTVPGQVRKGAATTARTAKSAKKAAQTRTNRPRSGSPPAGRRAARRA